MKEGISLGDREGNGSPVLFHKVEVCVEIQDFLVLPPQFLLELSDGLFVCLKLPVLVLDLHLLEPDGFVEDELSG